MATSNHSCSLDPSELETFFASQVWLPQLMEIKEFQEHISNNFDCPFHPPYTTIADVALIKGFSEDSASLITACAIGDFETVKRIVELWKVDILDTANHQDQGVSPLFVAASNAHLKIVRYILEKGAEESARTADGLTPLHGAIGISHWNSVSKIKKTNKIIRLLVESGADPSARTLNGAPMWSLLAEYSPIDTIATLIELGMSLTQRCQVKKYNNSAPLIYPRVYLSK